MEAAQHHAADDTVRNIANKNTRARLNSGVLFVDIRGARGLPPGDWLTGATAPYAEAAVAGQRRRTAVAPRTRDPQWGASFEFFDARLADALVVRVRAVRALLCLGGARALALAGQHFSLPSSP